MTRSGLLPEGDERHDKALAEGHDYVMSERAGGVHRPLVRSDVDVIVARYLASLAEQGARFVLVSDVADWLLEAPSWATPADCADRFHLEFGGGDEATASRRKEPQ